MSIRVPWGCVLKEGKTIINSSSLERRERGFLGETAIHLLERLGVSNEWLKICDAAKDPFATLEALMNGTYKAPAEPDDPNWQPPMTPEQKASLAAEDARRNKLANAKDDDK